MDKARLVRFFAGDNSFSFPNEQDFHDNFANPVVRLQSLPGISGGFDPHGSSPGPNEAGVVQCTTTVQAAARAAMTAKMDALHGMTNWGKGLLLAQPADSSEAVRWTYAKIHSIDTPHREDGHSDLWQPVQLTFACEDPLWYQQGTDGPIWGIAEWGDPWEAAPEVCAGGLTEFTVTNEGNADTLCRVTISCDTGQTAEDVTVQRVSSTSIVVDQVKYTGVLVAGDELIINPRGHTVTLNGAGAYDATFQANILHPDWFRIAPGSNTIRVRMANIGDACDVGMHFWYAWRNV